MSIIRKIMAKKEGGGQIFTMGDRMKKDKKKNEKKVKNEEEKKEKVFFCFKKKECVICIRLGYNKLERTIRAF